MADSIFKDKTLLITGGTGSFGHTVLKQLIADSEMSVSDKIDEWADR